jgi:hypothetical protein
MMRIFFLFVAALMLAYLLLQGSTMERSAEKPVFLQVDRVALAHATDIDVKVHSRYVPDSFQLEILKNDYSNLWAHLNHVYATNNIVEGKEYYTEKWFRQLARHYAGPVRTGVIREDAHHELHVENWSSDALVCTAIDSNVVLTYHFSGQAIKKTRANLAVVLLNQGDHWRIDAMKVLDETAY